MPAVSYYFWKICLNQEVKPVHKNLCMGCMNERGDEPICPFCGYTEGTLHFPSYLSPKTMLADRYLVGKVLSYNGEGVTYIGYDTLSERRIKIREYFPDHLAARSSDGQTVQPFQNRQIQYKAYLSDFIEIFQKLSKMRTLTCLVRVLGMEMANHTVYAIMEYVEGPTLRKYLDKKGAMLTYSETIDLLLPVIKTMQLIHEEGLLHRGLSSETLLVSENGLLKIDGFAISAVRAARTELVAELYPGFSAPEQYTTVSPHGKWTDVYALSALLYTCLTGQPPMEALIRSENHPLPSPRERNETVPAAAAEAIIKGLSMPIGNRLPDVETLIALLAQVELPRSSEAPTRPIAILHKNEYIPPSEPPRRISQSSVSTQSPRKTLPPVRVDVGKKEVNVERQESRRLFIWSTLISLGVLLLILIFTFWYLFGGRNQREASTSVPGTDDWSSFSSEENSFSSSVVSYGPSGEPSSSASSGGELLPVDEFIGKVYEEVVNDSSYEGVYVFRLGEEVYHEEQAAGVIVGQDIKAGTLTARPTEIVLKVSKGSRYLALPDYEKQTLESYEALLKSLSVEIPYTIAYRSDTGYPAGYVVEILGVLSGNRYDISTMPAIQLIVSQD